MTVRGLQFVAQLAQGAKDGAGILRIVAVGSHCHKTPDAKVRQRGQRGECGAQFIGCEAVLGFLARDIHFEKPFDGCPGFACNAINGLREGCAVNAVKEMKQRKGLADFVFLEVADEMPIETWWA